MSRLNKTYLKKKKKCHLKSQREDVVFLQEVHLIAKEAVKLKCMWVGQVFYSRFSSQKLGVAILIHKRLNFALLNQHKDEEGRFICVEAKIDGGKVNLCNIYAPNIEDLKFFYKINKLLVGLSDGQTLLGGDFNQVQDGILDKSTYSKRIPRDQQAIHQIVDDLSLVDIWRLINPREKKSLHFSPINIHLLQKSIIFYSLKL